MTQSTITTRDPALLATFYGQRGKLQPLLEHLRQGLGPLEAKGSNRWQDESRLIALDYLEPVMAKDASVIRIALSPPVGVEEAWQTLNWRLSQLLSEEGNRDAPEGNREGLPLLAGVWGYTLVYQAIADATTGSWGLLTDEEAGEAARKALFAKAHPLEPARLSPNLGEAKVSVLATANVTGGRLWLLRAPSDSDKLAATIYVALAPSDDEERALAQEVLLARHAMLFIPELIAHKAYHQRRQYRQNQVKERCEEEIDALLTQNARLLKPASDSQKVLPQEVSDQWKGFLVVVSELEQLHISLQRQQYNFEQWQERINRINGGAIFDFHHRYILTTLEELSLLIESAQKSLQTTQTAIALVQAELNQRREERDQTLQQWLAFIGIMLAAPQFISQDVATELLTLLAISKTGPDYHPFPILVLQLAIGLLFWGIARSASSLRG